MEEALPAIISLFIKGRCNLYNFKVNAICPGYIKTEMNEKIFENEKFRKYILNNIPERRLGKPEDLRELIVLLASDESDYINGALLTVDGGWTVS